MKRKLLLLLMAIVTLFCSVALVACDSVPEGEGGGDGGGNNPPSVSYCEVTFDTLGGSYVDYQTVEKGQTATIPTFDPIKTGYKFNGWNFDFSTPINSDTTISVNPWIANTYTIKFDKGEATGSETMADQVFTYDVAQDLTANTFTYANHAFTGWLCSGTTYLDGDEIENLTDVDGTELTFVAQWRALGYTVKFDKGEATGSETMADQTFVAGQAQALTMNTFTYEGYTFVGWLYSGTTYTNGQQINLDVEDGAEVTFVAQWEDTTDPVLTAFSMPVGFATQEYTLPTITVTDGVDGAITPTITVYKKGDSANPLTIAEGKFTPATAGYHVIKVEAEDNAGNTISQEVEFVVRNNADVTVLENFDDECGLANSLNDNKEILDTYQGKNGVLKISAKNSGDVTAYTFKLMRPASAYTQEFTSFNIVVYFSEYVDAYFTKNAPVSTDNWVGINGGAWTTLTINVANYGTFAEFINQATSENGIQLFWVWTHSVDLYVDQIYNYVKPVDEEEDGVVESFSLANDVNQVSYFVDGSGAGETTWVESFEGRTGVVCVNDAEAHYGYRITVSTSYEKLVASNWTTMTIDLYIPSTSLNAEQEGCAWLTWGKDVDTNENPINNDIWVTDSWQTITINRASLADADAFMKALTGDGAHLFGVWGCNRIAIDKITIA